KSKMDVNLRQFPSGYWSYLSVIAVFGLGNSSNSFLILRTQDIGVPLEATILMYALFNLAAALISYPAGFFSDRLGRKNVLLASFIVLRSPILASPMHRMSCPSLHYLSSTVYIREYFGQSGKHSHRILFPKIYAQAQSDGTAAS